MTGLYFLPELYGVKAMHFYGV